MVEPYVSRSMRFEAMLAEKSDDELLTLATHCLNMHKIYPRDDLRYDEKCACQKECRKEGRRAGLWEEVVAAREELVRKGKQ